MLARAAIVSIVFFALWLLMSGIYEPLIIGFGVVSSVLCVWIINRLQILDARGLSNQIGLLSFGRYLFWLTVEIGKADWAVMKIILAPDALVRQRLIHVPAGQKTDFGKMLFANSITITPGTITVETEPDHFIVHALSDDAADKDALAVMENKVSALEKREDQEADT